MPLLEVERVAPSPASLVPAGEQDPLADVMVGGQVQPLSHGVAGALTAVALDRLAFDVAFLGADAVDAEKGLGEPTVEEAYVKELVATRAGRVVLLVDGSKFAPAGAPAWTRIPPSWTVLTDPGVDEATVTAYARRGVTIVRAD